jgi:arylsulfatase A-like enzyme
MQLHRSHPIARANRAMAAVLVALATTVACAPRADAPASVTLVNALESATISRTPEVAPATPVAWNFTEGTAPGTVAGELLGAVALYDVEGLELRDGLLHGTTTGSRPVVHIPVAEDAEVDDRLHAVELRMRVSGGDLVALDWDSDEELDVEELTEELEKSKEDEDRPPPRLNAPAVEGDEVHTYLLSANVLFRAPPLRRMRHLLVIPGRAEGVDFAIESVRLISRKEHLASIESGVSWQGLNEIYRETLVTRAPERVELPLRIPSDPWLDLHVGTIEPGVSKFRVAIEDGGREVELLERTVTTADRWEHLEIDLAEWAGREVTLRLEGTATEEGTLLFWGGPVVRSRRDVLRTAEASEARAALSAEPGTVEPPRRILFILADTLRRDRLPFYGGERDNAPVLSKIAEEGTVFTRNVSQGTWTKVSVPSILTSLYPTSHGIVEPADRLPSSVTTLAEALRDAGYATYATSSVGFTGKMTALHQGIETLHESGSVPELDHSYSKTARVFVDRLLPWIDEHSETPFFVFLHVFDPHDPFRPYAPYETLYTDDEEIAEHEERIARMNAFLAEEEGEEVDEDDAYGPLPRAEQLEKAGIDADAWVDTELDWYDASIRAMDAEIGRVLERLDQLDILEDTLIVFTSDHGEEFLEHGNHFHGLHAYGEMINVPLVMWWPGVVPAGRSDVVVQSIDVYPTVLALAGLEPPREAQQIQGQSLLPLMADPDRPSRLGWLDRPAFAERAVTKELGFQLPVKEQVAQQVVVSEGWKLVRNLDPPSGRAEYELYDAVADPLDQNDVAAENTEVVSRLRADLDAWHETALAAKIEEVSPEEMSPEDRERLRSLGYIQ